MEEFMEGEHDIVVTTFAKTFGMVEPGSAL
jgi:hypothetical protein